MATRNLRRATLGQQQPKADAWANFSVVTKSGTEIKVGTSGIPIYEGTRLGDAILAQLARDPEFQFNVVMHVNVVTPEDELEEIEF